MITNKPRSKKHITVIPKVTPKIKVVPVKKIEIQKYQKHLKDILMNTNATPIRCKGGIGYTCCFCTNQYPDPADLKRHTIEKHDVKTISDLMKGIALDDFVVKLDVTDLKCQCGRNFNNIHDIIKHLNEIHNTDIDEDLSKRIVPFDFKGALHCVICSQEFNNFKVLMGHMNVHYRNHVCEVCGAGFVNRRTLRTHSYRHETGTFPCKECFKVFDTRVKKMEHERAVHVHGNRRNKCGYCGEKFTDYTKKNYHEVKLHGAKPIVLHCRACDKVFDNQRSLTVHSKTYHSLLRK